METEVNFDAFSPFRVDAAAFAADTSLWNSFCERIEKSPELVKDLLFLPSTVEFLLNLGEESRLNSEQSAELSRIIRDVLLGSVFVGSIQALIAEKLHVPDQTAQSIREKIVTELFAPALNDIKGIQRKNFPEQAGQTQESSVSVPSQDQAQSNTIDLRNR